MSTIQATVNTRLLGKANRLFTGTLAGRIIEILQNARRANATHVAISNRGGMVTVRDNGRGIGDFARLLDLGGSGWEEKLEASEDPAGVGLFCLAPREVTIRSLGQVVTIEGDGWAGADVEVRADPQPLPARHGMRKGAGTKLRFADEPWELEVVKPLAAFTGLIVMVDGRECPKERFICAPAVSHPELGCRLTVVRESEITTWHRSAIPDHEYGRDVLVNFHGQVVAFSHRPVNNHDLHFLVDMTGEPTGIRLMLPARTRLVENEALKQLKAVLELEAFKYLQRQGHHCLPYQQYMRARELGIELPEAQPQYFPGLLQDYHGPSPVEVSMPEGHSLAQCYRLAEIKDGHESDTANVHLLAALGRFDQPFVPVEIGSEYDGYSWARLPTIGRVKATAGKTLAESWVDGALVVCVQSLSITVHCSDGTVFQSSVCLAVKPWEGKGEPGWFDEGEVYVTPDAQRQLGNEQIWYHCGGYRDDGDTYDTQLDSFAEQLDAFWLRLTGPEEPMRCKLMECLRDLPQGWQSVTIQSDGRVAIHQGDGTETTLLPPELVPAAGKEEAAP